jgi:hypothetical protein
LVHEVKLIKPASIFMAIALAFGFSPVAIAKNRQQRPPVGYAQIMCNMRGCSDRTVRQQRNILETRISPARAQVDANGNAVVVGGRPAGCPQAFCGCEASRYVFGKIRPELNLASNWVRHFPRSIPASGMAAVRSHHVMILIRQVVGSDWLVHDGNSGGNLTREHVRSISGYIVVDPHATRVANK